MHKPDTVYSQMFRGGSRMYFFDVYEGVTGKRLVLTTSAISHGKKFRHQVTIFQDDLTAFFAEFIKALGSFDLNRAEFLQKMGLPDEASGESPDMSDFRQ